MTEHQASPALSGDATQFTLGGNVPYSNAIWYKTLSGDTGPSHFTYDVYFYLEDPQAPQALEFDVNQAIGKNRYVWGTECDFHDTHRWNIWDAQAGIWRATKVPCDIVSANDWHHLVWQFERVGEQMHYISVTLDDVTSTVDTLYGFQRGFAGDGYDVAFQMDGNYHQQPYTVWIDKLNLSAW
jgi:hypothetical protein